jgi:hypothetical protein
MSVPPRTSRCVLAPLPLQEIAALTFARDLRDLRLARRSAVGTPLAEHLVGARLRFRVPDLYHPPGA